MADVAELSEMILDDVRKALDLSDHAAVMEALQALGSVILSLAAPDGAEISDTMVEDYVSSVRAALDVTDDPERVAESLVACACEIVADSRVSETAAAERVSDKPWSDFSASDYTDEQWFAATLLHTNGDSRVKSDNKLPVREPGGMLNRNGVHAAAAAVAGARGGVDATPEQLAQVKRRLRGLYEILGEEPPESIAASLVAADTHDAPGWLTDPVATQRLRDYWTKGEGAAKIGWGTPGDLTRCASYLSKYVGPEFSWGTCQNLHYEVFGEFNPESRGASIDIPEGVAAAVQAAFTAAAELEEAPAPPIEQFSDPGLTAATALTIDPNDEDHVFGHLATWGTCHVGIEGRCVTAPKSQYDYAYFRTGEAMTAGGPVAVGQITLDTGHAEPSLGARAAAAHYDDTGAAVADVAVGEDEFGIWVNGRLRPGLNDAQRRSLRAGALSGDWRRIGGNLELVAALVVNVPGFPIPRTEMSVAASGHEMSLVAAAVVTVDPNVLLASDIADIVVDRLEADAARKARAAELRAQITQVRQERLVAAAK